jgi:hypothetical protein
MSLVVAFLAGCDTSGVLPEGCYYSGAGVAILDVHGDRGVVLIPGEVREVRLQRGRRWSGAYVDVEPGFYLRGAEHREVSTGTDPVPRSFRFSFEETPVGPALMVNIEAYGEEPVRRGPPCPQGRTSR